MSREELGNHCQECRAGHFVTLFGDYLSGQALEREETWFPGGQAGGSNLTMSAKCSNA